MKKLRSFGSKALLLLALTAPSAALAQVDYQTALSSCDPGSGKYTTNCPAKDVRRNDIDPTCISQQNSSGCLNTMPVNGVSRIPEDLCYRDWSGRQGNHEGMDYAPSGDMNAYSAADGVVELVSNCSGGYGRKVDIVHSLGGKISTSELAALVKSSKTPKNEVYRSRYAHLASINVSMGQTVSKGSKIGVIGGSTCKNGSPVDNAYPIHLHFELQNGTGSVLDPMCSNIQGLCGGTAMDTTSCRKNCNDAGSNCQPSTYDQSMADKALSDACVPETDIGDGSSDMVDDLTDIKSGGDDITQSGSDDNWTGSCSAPNAYLYTECGGSSSNTDGPGGNSSDINVTPLHNIPKYGAVGGKSGLSSNTCVEIPEDVRGYIDEAATKYGVDPLLIAAIISQESGWNANAKSYVGATGYMQLMPATFAGLNVGNDINDPKQNIMAGTKYIKQMRDYYKDKANGDEGLLWSYSLAAYNAGPGNVNKAIAKCGDGWIDCMPRVEETKPYADRGDENTRSVYNFYKTTENCSGITGSIPNAGKCESYSEGGAGKCNIKQYIYDYNRECLFCNMFTLLFNAASTVAQQAYNALAKAIQTVVVVGLACWIAWTILKFISNLEQIEPRELIKNLLNQLFITLMVILLLRMQPSEFLNLFMAPIFDTGFALANIAMNGTACENTFGIMKNGGLPESMGVNIICSIQNVQIAITKVIALGSTSTCIALWIKSAWGLPIFPHFGYLIVGILLWIGGVLLLVIYPFLLIDSILKLCVTSALLPAAIGCHAFKITRNQYTGKVFEAMMSSMFSFVFLTIMLFMLIFQINETVKEGLSEAALNGDQQAFLTELAWTGVAALKLVFIIFLGWAVLEQFEGFVSGFVGGGSLDVGGIGTKVGGLAVNTSRKIGGKALSVANKTRKKAGRVVGDMARERYHSVKNKAIAWNTRRYMNTVDNGDGTFTRTGRNIFGRETTRTINSTDAARIGRSVTVDNGDGTFTRTSKNLFGRTTKRTIAFSAAGKPVITKETEQKKLSWSWKKPFSVNVETDKRTMINDGIIKYSKKTKANGEVAETLSMLTAGGRSLLNRDGTNNTVAMNAIRQKSSLSAELVEKAIMKQLIKERMGGLGLSMENAIISSTPVFDVDGNLIGYKDAQGNMIDAYGNAIAAGAGPVMVDAHGNTSKVAKDGNGDLVDKNGNFVGRVDADGTVRDASGQKIGDFKDAGTAFVDDNGKLLGTTQPMSYVNSEGYTVVTVVQLSPDGTQTTFTMKTSPDGKRTRVSVESISRGGRNVSLHSSDGIVNKRMTYSKDRDGNVIAASVDRRYAFADKYRRSDNREINALGDYASNIPSDGIVWDDSDDEAKLKTQYYRLGKSYNLHGFTK